MPVVESGGYISDSGQQWGYVRVEYSTAEYSDRVDYTLNLYIRTTGSISDSFNTWSVGGASGSNRPISIGSGGGTFFMGSHSGSASKNYGGGYTFDFTGTIGGIEIFNNLGSVGGSFWVPRRLYSAPAAPSGCAVARVSDTSHTVSWTNNSPWSSSAPYSNVEVYRSTDGGAYAKVATLGVVTSWSDKTTSADHSYKYKVRATNIDAVSSYSNETSVVYTTPAPPGAPTAAKSGSDIVLTFTNAALHDVGIKVYESQNGGAFSLLATVATANLTTYTHVAPNASVTHAYKVTAYNGSLESAQSAASNTVQLLAAPNAPTRLGPSGVLDATENVIFSWQPNPVDTTPQTAYELQYRISGGGWTTLSGTTAATRTVPGGTLSNGQTYEWQVRTKGSHADWSPWSSLGSFPTSTRPTATLSVPGATVTSSALTMSWAYYDAESTAQATFKAILRSSTGVILHQATVASAATSYLFPTYLEDATTYEAAILVQDGAGLWSLEDNQTFTVGYAPPPVPTITLTWDMDTGTSNVEITNPGPGAGEVATVSNFVYRSTDRATIAAAETYLLDTGNAANKALYDTLFAATKVLLGSTTANSALTDMIPAVGAKNVYQATAISASPSSNVSLPGVIETTPHGSWVWMNVGSGFGTSYRLKHGAQIKMTQRRAKASNVYAGRTYGVETVGDFRDHRISVSARIGTGASTADELEELMDQPAPICFRDPSGRRWFVSADDLDFTHEGVIQKVQLSFLREDHDE